MNKEDLKNKIESFYVQSLNADIPESFIVLDAIKSIIGINLDQISTNLLDWFSGYISTAKLSIYEPKNFTDTPGAISFYSLESALLENDKEGACEAIFYLSRVSEGTQIFEFLLEFSLKHTEFCFKYIWHILRLESFFDGKYRLESLNRCAELLVEEEYVEYTPSLLDCLSNWEDYLSLNIKDQENVFLCYTIYKSDLIRFTEIRKLIICRLDRLNKEECPKIDTKIKKEQITEGRFWINKYFSNLKIENIQLSQVVLFDKIRSCLLLSKEDLNVQLLWSHLNEDLCN